MNHDIDTILRNVAATYKRMLQHFRPCKPGGEFLEQNLITLLSHEFLKQHEDGLAFSEVPFLKQNSHVWGNRIDAYLATNDSAYFVEAKGSQSKEDLFVLIEDDLQRIQSSELKTSFKLMANGFADANSQDRDYGFPPKLFGLVIADCWYKSHVDQWTQNNTLTSKYPLISQLSTKAYEVGQYGKFNYCILAGLLPLNDWSSKIKKPP